MPLGDPYITLDELKDYLEIPRTDNVDDVRLNVARSAARETTESFCRRQFNDAGTPVSTRQFTSHTLRRAIIDDFSTTTGLVVRIGSRSSGFTTTWTLDSDYYVGPVNQTRNERPDQAYWRLNTLLNQRFTHATYRRDEPNIEVDAQWGWSAVPQGVVEANLLMAARLYRRRDSPDGIVSGFEGAPVRVSWMLDPDAKRQLAPYRKHVPGMM